MKMSEIARHLGVSQATVSLTLNGNGDKYKISPETQARILEYVESVGYVPDADAVRMVRGNVRQVAVVIHRDTELLTELQRAFFFDFIKLIHDAGVPVLIQSITEGTAYEAFRTIAGKKINDIVVIGFATAEVCERCPAILPLIRTRKLIFVDYYFNDWSPPCLDVAQSIRIGFDRRQVVLELLHLFSRHQHQTIAVAHDLRFFLPKPLPADLPFAIHIVSADYTVHDAFERGKELAHTMVALYHQQGCTTFAARDDMLAIGLIAGLRDAGLRVPDDISISGFDNLPASATCAVPLTTIAVPMPEMLDTVGQHLLSETNLDGDILIPGHIIERASVGEARRTAAA